MSVFKEGGRETFWAGGTWWVHPGSRRQDGSLRNTQTSKMAGPSRCLAMGLTIPLNRWINIKVPCPRITQFQTFHPNNRWWEIRWECKRSSFWSPFPRSSSPSQDNESKQTWDFLKPSCKKSVDPLPQKPEIVMIIVLDSPTIGCVTLIILINLHEILENGC